MPTPQSPALLLREFTPGDFDLFCRVYGSAQVTQYTLQDRAAPAELEQYFARVLVCAGTPPGPGRKYYEYAVFSREDGSFVGLGDIEVDIHNDRGGSGEMGYLLLPESWGRGYGTALATALCDFCFNALGLHRVYGRCNAGNAASVAVMKKLGMRCEARLRRVRFKDGAWHDELHYGVLADEWRAR